MKKIIGIILTAVFTASALSSCASSSSDKLAQIKKTGKITMATSPDYAPMEFMDVSKSGQDAIVGADIELGKYIAQQLGVQLVIESMDFSAVQAAVSQGKADMGISGFAYTDERAQSMLLSDYYGIDSDTRQGILILKENADKLAKKEDFSGKKIAAQNASLQYNLVSKQLPDAAIEPITNLNDAVLMLINGKIDGVAVSGDNGDAFAKNYEKAALSSFLFDYTSEGQVIAVTKGQQPLMDEINKIIADVNKKQLFAKWREDATNLAASLGVGN